MQLDLTDLRLFVRVAEEGQLMSFLHHGFWQPMDTLRDKSLLEERWSQGKAEWKLWQ